MAFDSKVAQC